jgi:hypothetical protein
MIKEVTFLLTLLITTSSPLSISVLLNSHEIAIGESPFVTEHWRETASPALMVSSPAENGII